jgi:hypothetical protein
MSLWEEIAKARAQLESALTARHSEDKQTAAINFVFLLEEKSAVCDRSLFFSGEEVRNAATAATAATRRKLHVVFCSGQPLQPLRSAATNCPP